MEICIYQDKECAAVRLASEIAGLVGRRTRSGLTTVLGLATGATPLPLYAELVRLHKEEGLSFGSVITFNLDEYAGLGPEDRNSYRRFMDEVFFDHVDIPRDSTHFLDGLTDHPEAACEHYEEAIIRAGGIDMQVLGIGRTGHIGFNEPPSDAGSRTRLIRLDERTRSDNSIFFDDQSQVPIGALTMGIATILEAKRVELMAFGESKADVVRRAIQEPPSPACPASWLQQHPACTFHLDKASSLSL
jgi:glucosamine-6-phosphate deaminase